MKGASPRPILCQASRNSFVSYCFAGSQYARAPFLSRTQHLLTSSGFSPAIGTVTEPIAHNPANFSVDLFSPAAASEYRGQVVVLLVVVLLVVSAGPSVVEYNNGMWKAKSVTWTLAPGGMMNGSANASGAAWTKQFAPPSGTTEINATVSVKGTYTFVDSNSQSMMMEIDGTSDSSPIAWSSSNLTVSWVISLDDSGLSVV